MSKGEDRLITQAIVVWLILLAAAVANGAVRDALVSPRVGEHPGHVISCFTLSALILILVFLTFKWLNPPENKNLYQVGLLWLGLTVAFEFIAGHYLFGNSWQTILADYNVFRGRLWPLVLVTTLSSPVVVAKLRSLR